MRSLFKSHAKTNESGLQNTYDCHKKGGGGATEVESRGDRKN